jgi:hypothetical protein
MKRIDTRLFSIPDIKLFSSLNIDREAQYTFIVLVHKDTYFVPGIIIDTYFTPLNLGEIEKYKNEEYLIWENYINLLSAGIKLDSLTGFGYNGFLEYEVFSNFKIKNEHLFK